jgi:hypothetical protein
MQPNAQRRHCGGIAAALRSQYVRLRSAAFAAVPLQSLRCPRDMTRMSLVTSSGCPWGELPAAPQGKGFPNGFETLLKPFQVALQVDRRRRLARARKLSRPGRPAPAVGRAAGAEGRRVTDSVTVTEVVTGHAGAGLAPAAVCSDACRTRGWRVEYWDNWRASTSSVLMPAAAGGAATGAGVDAAAGSGSIAACGTAAGGAAGARVTVGAAVAGFGV